MSGAALHGVLQPAVLVVLVPREALAAGGFLALVEAPSRQPSFISSSYVHVIALPTLALGDSL